MQRRRLFMAAVTLAALAAGAVGWWLARSQPRRPRQPNVAPPLRFALTYAGCEAAHRGDICLVKPQTTLTLWLRVPTAATVTIRTCDQRLGAKPQTIGGGHRYRVPLPRICPRVDVEVSHNGQVGRRSLTLRPHRRDPRLIEARRLLLAGEVDASAALFDEERRGPLARLPGPLASHLARVALHRGQTDRAEQLLRAAMALHRRRGAHSELVRDTTVLVYVLLDRRGQIQRARRALASLRGVLPDFAPSQFHRLYYRGSLARKTGDHRTAEASLRRAEQLARRLDLKQLRPMAAQMLALELQNLGRRAEAHEIYRGLLRDLPATAGPCQRATLLTNYSWNRLLALEAMDPTVSDPTPQLRQVLQLLRPACLGAAQRRVNARINLALAQLRFGSEAEVEAELRAARRSSRSLTPENALWLDDIAGRLALRRKQGTQALRCFARMDRRARALGDPAARRRATVGRAQALQLQGRVEAALGAYDGAQALVRRALFQVGLGSGRARFAAQHRRGFGQHLELLLDLGRVEQGLNLVRATRTLALREVQRSVRIARLPPAGRQQWYAALDRFRRARRLLHRRVAEQWRLPSNQQKLQQQQLAQARADQMRRLDEAMKLLPQAESRGRPPAPGELQLVYESAAGGLFGLAVERGEDRAGAPTEKVTVARLKQAPNDAAARSETLLRPFAAAIDRAQQITILAGGPTTQMDLHALPWRGQPLVARVPVAYSLGLAGSGDRLPATRAALLVADPRGDLPHAARSVRRVEARLAGQTPRWSVTLLSGTQALPAAVTRALAQVDLFHFAGHGESPGSNRWNDALVLAEQTRLWPAEVLALPRVPRRVVLLGCDTATSDPRQVNDVGLAESFLVSGARSVVASSRPLADRMAARFSAALYAGAPARTADQPSVATAETAPDAFRRAVARLREHDPRSDWAALRLFVR